MTLKTGTHDVSSLLQVTNVSVAEFGAEEVAETLRTELAAHNAITVEMITELAEPTTERSGVSGTGDAGDMVKVDEYGRGPTQKGGVPATMGYPLERVQYAIGWTSTWMQVNSPADMAKAVLAGEKAHRRQLQRDIKLAIFGPTNYTFKDYLVDNAEIAVKRFVNADSVALPEGPNGETFTASTHTHYDAIATLTNASAIALVDDVVEHGHGENVRIYINKADEATWRALDDFLPYLDPRITVGISADSASGRRLDITRLDNRAIGIIGAAEIWVKPWVPAGYAFAFSATDPAKPLKFRQRPQAALQGLRIAAELDTHPLHARYLEADYGFAVGTRTNGAVLYFGTSGTYAEPSF
jgi:hypothetical protein